MTRFINHFSLVAGTVVGAGVGAVAGAVAESKHKKEGTHDNEK